MAETNQNTISWTDFEKVDIRIGTIINATSFPGAKKPAYKLKIDFGELGQKQSSAQITELYKVEDLVGQQIVAIVNFPPKQIANYISECLVMGIYGSENHVVLLQPEQHVPNGSKIG